MKNKCKKCKDRKWKQETGACIDCANLEGKARIKYAIKIAEREIQEWIKFLDDLHKQLNEKPTKVHRV
jgi:hypothetical protein